MLQGSGAQIEQLRTRLNTPSLRRLKLPPITLSSPIRCCYDVVFASRSGAPTTPDAASAALASEAQAHASEAAAEGAQSVA